MMSDGDYIPWELDTTIDILADVRQIFDNAGIRIIRMGLQTTDEICPGAAVVGGPFHEAIGELARIAYMENENSENIGARRLHTVMETLLEDVSFNACGGHPDVELVIDKKYVVEHMERVTRYMNLKKYIL